jgi:small subunit ribosomal protein S20
MPHSLSVKKRIRQNSKRRLRNRSVKSALRAQVKKFRAVLESGDAEAKQREFLAAVRVLDRAVTRGVIHKNAAARRKSRLAAKLSKPAATAPTS